jgi:GNAT superfamily N-acetyltransferase
MREGDSAFSIVKLSATINLASFDCGEPARNSWLSSRALANQGSDDSRTYVATAPDGRLLGFYAIATGAVIRTDLPSSLRKNAPNPVSCLLLAQLAVDKTMQGQGLGKTLVLHALGQTAAVADIVSCRILVVHAARPRLIRFYERFGFISLPSQPLAMAVSLKTVRETLKAVQPL